MSTLLSSSQSADVITTRERRKSKASFAGHRHASESTPLTSQKSLPWDPRPASPRRRPRPRPHTSAHGSRTDTPDMKTRRIRRRSAATRQGANATRKQATNPDITRHVFYGSGSVVLYAGGTVKPGDELVHLRTNDGQQSSWKHLAACAAYRLGDDCWRPKYVAAEHRRRRACP